MRERVDAAVEHHHCYQKLTMSTQRCPCTKKWKSAKLSCSQCEQWWHSKCVGLKGLGDRELKMLTSWLCPQCYVYPPAIKPELTKVEKVVKSESDKVLSQIKESALSTEMIKAAVSEAVSTAVNKNTEDTKKVITETLHEKNAQVINDVMKSSKEMMDSDTVARDQRRCNVTVRNIPESTHRAGRDRLAEDKRFALRILNITEDQLVHVVRAGPPIGSRPNDTRVSRVMIITVDTPEHANYLHNYGRGWRRKTTDGRMLWVNPDLIKADRDANWRARQLAKNRRPDYRVLDQINASQNRSLNASRNSATTPVHVARMPVINRDRVLSTSTISSADAATPNDHNMSAGSQDQHNLSTRSLDQDIPDFV